MALTKKKRNKISRLKDAARNWCGKGQGLEQLVLDYYIELFTSQGGDNFKVCSLIQEGITLEKN